MQERAYEKRGEQYLLIKSPPASGKSRALMFVALDKLYNQGLRNAIIVVPEKSIGSSFADEPLSKFGFWADWTVTPKWNLCNAPGEDGGKVSSVQAFLDSADRVLVCTHATFRFAVDRFGIVGPIEMQEAIGATKAQLRSLRDDGVLRPRISRTKINSPWRIADGYALLEELGKLAIEISPDDACWEEIQAASKRRRLRVGDIISAVREGSLGLGRSPEAYGYRSFRVLKAEIDSLSRTKIPTPIVQDSCLSGQPASAFARSIGMRSKGWFQNLFDAGYVSATWEQNPRTNVRMLCVSETDVADFNKRFLTLTQMQAEFGLHRQTCAAILKAACVHPFAPGGQDFGQLFERKRAEPVLLNARRGL